MTTTDNEMSPGAVGLCEPLLAMARPDLYTLNPFRVLGVTVDASIQDIRRLQQRRRMQAELGIRDTSAEASTLFPPSSEAEIERGALEALARPVDRMLSELFWFWPLDSDDEAVVALATGDGVRALAVWEAAAQEGVVAARHNLAVFHHARSLEGEGASASNPPSSGDGVPASSPEQALELWSDVVRHDDFWARLRERAAEMDDPRLTPAFVEQIHGTLPTTLLTVHAKIAHAVAVSGDYDRARRHVALLRSGMFEAHVGEHAIREALAPLRERIRGAIQDAKRTWTAKPQHGATAVAELHRRGEKLLAVVDQLLPEDDSTRRGLHDELAQAIVDGEYAFSMATNEWQRGRALLELALRVVSGSALRDRIEDGIRQNDGLVESGNHWCAPGYWELPEAEIAELESARERVKAGDFEGAIAALLEMAPDVGRPLRRALANALSQSGIGMSNRARWEAEPVKRIMARLDGLELAQKALLLARRPDPSTFAELNPPCLSCQRGGYTQWINFTHGDLPMFMCDRCRQEWDREIAKVTETALEYLILADEIDPSDPGITRNLEAIRSNARELGCTIPTAERLREELTGSLLRGTRVESRASASSTACHFCGEVEPDPDAAVTVPMCGDVRPTSFVLGEGCSYGFDEVTVPRCARCREEHAELVRAIEAWRLAHAAAGDDESFPELVAAIEAATQEDAEQRAAVERAQKRLDEARAAVTAASALPTECDRCGGDAQLEDGLCRTCDADVFGIGWREGALGVGMAAAALANLFFGAGTGLIQSLSSSYAARTGALLVDAAGVVAMAGTGAVGAGLALLLGAVSWRRRVERDELREARRGEFEARQEQSVEDSGKLVERRLKELASAKSAAPASDERLEAARARLAEAKEEARVKYEAENPWPALPRGVASESGYLEFPLIVRRRAEGWGFGSAPLSVSGELGQEPVEVTGLVS